VEEVQGAWEAGEVGVGAGAGVAALVGAEVELVEAGAGKAVAAEEEEGAEATAGWEKVVEEVAACKFQGCEDAELVRQGENRLYDSNAALSCCAKPFAAISAVQPKLPPRARRRLGSWRGWVRWQGRHRWRRGTSPPH
jgi:hypothetical protein